MPVYSGSKKISISVPKLSKKYIEKVKRRQSQCGNLKNDSSVTAIPNKVTDSTQSEKPTLQNLPGTSDQLDSSIDSEIGTNSNLIAAVNIDSKRIETSFPVPSDKSGIGSIIGSALNSLNDDIACNFPETSSFPTEGTSSSVHADLDFETEAAFDSRIGSEIAHQLAATVRVIDRREAKKNGSINRPGASKVPCWKQPTAEKEKGNEYDFSDPSDHEEIAENEGAEDMGEEEEEDEEDIEGSEVQDEEQEEVPMNSDISSSDAEESDMDENDKRKKRGASAAYPKNYNKSKQFSNGDVQKKSKNSAPEEMTFMNWMPKSVRTQNRIWQDGTFEAEYVTDKCWTENGKVWAKKERKKITWSIEPPPGSSRLDIDNEIEITAAQHLRDQANDPVAIFNEIFTDEICSKIGDYTNPCMEQRLADHFAHYASGSKTSYKDVDIMELRAFIGSLIFLGANHKNVLDTGKLFSTIWYEVNLPLLLAFSRERYQNLLQTLTFNDDSTGPPNRETSQDTAEEKSERMQEIFDLVIENFESLVEGGKVITLDRTFIHYLKSKFQVFCVCDSQTGYLLNAELCFKRIKRRDTDKLQEMMLDLTEPCAGNDRIIIADQCFISIETAEKLKSKQLNLVGPIPEEFPGLPEEFLRANLNKKESCVEEDDLDETLSLVVRQGSRKRKMGNPKPDCPRSGFLFTENMTVVKTQLSKKEYEFFFSTAHHAPLVSSDFTARPEIALCYDQGRSGVELLDRKIAEFTCEQKIHRWTMRIFMWLVDVAAHNAYVIHKSILKESAQSRRDFLVDLGMKLMEPQIQRRCKIPAGHSLRNAKQAAFWTMSLKKNASIEDIQRLLGNPSADRETKVNSGDASTSAGPSRFAGRKLCQAVKGCKMRIKAKCEDCKRYACSNHRQQSGFPKKKIQCKICYDRTLFGFQGDDDRVYHPDKGRKHCKIVKGCKLKGKIRCDECKKFACPNHRQAFGVPKRIWCDNCFMRSDQTAST